MNDDLQLAAIREKKRRELEKRLAGDKPMTAGVRVLNQENFAGVVASEKNLVIDFWAPWCGPCRMVAPVIEELAAVYAGRVTFAKCNTDENQEIAAHFGISAIPTLFFCQNGQLVNRVAGALPRPHLEEEMKRSFQL
ncbi:MAG: thioredoxin [Methanospirillaceae archaeon]|nr:thioredoxin [Methanospirillaceae archaeon]